MIDYLSLNPNNDKQYFFYSKMIKSANCFDAICPGYQNSFCTILVKLSVHANFRNRNLHCLNSRPGDVKCLLISSVKKLSGHKKHFNERIVNFMLHVKFPLYLTLFRLGYFGSI